MDVEFVSYATVRDAIGTKSVTRDLPEGTTVEDALRDLAVEYEGLDSLLFTSDGEIRPHVNVLVNDENIRDRDGQATTLSAGDTVGLAPGVAGGGRVGVIDA
jgi:molybdopterin synthase sulfur carrier subunit